MFIFLVIIGLATTFLVTSDDHTGNQVVIKAGGQIYGTYDLDKNQTIEVNYNGHRNNVTIKNGKVSMTFSDCLNQNCVHQGSINRTSQAIICLPNKIVVEIKGKGGETLDVISN
ncbi:NusG domain II-containing protein [Eubacteriales bacterium KG127]